MSDSAFFELLCAQLAQHEGLSRLEARGTIRLLLKELGLEAEHLNRCASLLVIDHCLEQALRVRRVGDPAQTKAHVLKAVRASELPDPVGDEPEQIVARIALRSGLPRE